MSKSRGVPPVAPKRTSLASMANGGSECFQFLSMKLDLFFFDMFRKFWRIWAAGEKVASFHISVQDVGGVPKWKKLKLKNLSRRDYRNTQIIRTFFHQLVFEIR